MHERVATARSIERRIIEYYSPADTPHRTIGSALCTDGQPRQRFMPSVAFGPPWRLSRHQANPQ